MKGWTCKQEENTVYQGTRIGKKRLRFCCYFNLLQSHLASLKVGRPQISNPQICGLNNLLDLRTFHKCGTLRICDLQIFKLWICDLRTNVFCGLETSASPQVQTFLLTNITQNFNLYKIQNHFKKDNIQDCFKTVFCRIFADFRFAD